LRFGKTPTSAANPQTEISRKERKGRQEDEFNKEIYLYALGDRGAEKILESKNTVSRKER
jgi:hypothetical protein